MRVRRAAMIPRRAARKKTTTNPEPRHGKSIHCMSHVPNPFLGGGFARGTPMQNRKRKHPAPRRAGPSPPRHPARAGTVSAGSSPAASRAGKSSARQPVPATRSFGGAAQAPSAPARSSAIGATATATAASSRFAPQSSLARSRKSQVHRWRPRYGPLPLSWTHSVQNVWTESSARAITTTTGCASSDLAGQSAVHILPKYNARARRRCLWNPKP